MAGNIAMVETEDTLAPDIRVKSQYINENTWGDAYSFHFATGVRTLNSRQYRILRDELIPYMTPGSWCEFYGLADRTGSQQVNYRVSEERLFHFQLECSMLGADTTIAYARQHKYFGEDYLAHVDQNEHKNRDGSSNFFGRCVTAWIWSNKQATNRIFANYPFLKFARTTPQP